MTINGRDARRVWALLGLLSLAGMVGLIGLLLFLRGWDEAAKVAGVVSILLAVAPSAAQLMARLRRGSSSTLTGEQVAQARELLAMRVREQWRRESAARSLGDPEPMPVRWTLTERAVMDHPKLVLAGSGFAGRSDAIDSLAGEFTQLTRRRLVILGPAGAGKTTLAVQLLLELLDTRTPDEPVPVLLSLAGWDTTTAPRLQDWLADRLAQDYPAVRAVSQGAPRALVEQGLVLPILDGLDELPDHYRPTVLVAINASLGATDPLVLTCRTDEYRDAVGASDVITAAAVIEPDPLSCSEAADYLLTCLPPDLGGSWRKVLAALREGEAPALAEVCVAPLGLWLVRMVYIAGRVDPAPLLDHADATTLRAEMLDQLIPTVIRARPPTHDSEDPLRPRRSWNSDDVRRWLSLLAQQLDRKRDLLWWHLPRRTFSPWLVGLLVGLLFGLLVVLLFWLLVGLVFELPGGLAIRLAIGLAIELVIGLIVGWQVKTQIAASEPKYANLQWHGRSALLVFQLPGWLVGGLVVGLVFGLVGGLPGGLAFELTIGLLVGFVTCLCLWMETPSITDRVGTPRTIHSSDRIVTVVQSVLVGLVFGLLGGFASGLPGGLVSGLFFGLASGSVSWLVFGLASWLVFGLYFGLVGLAGRGNRAWLYYVLAARWLAVTGRLPWRLMGFLDDAYRLGLLRMVGPAYQFRHAELQDHLAGTRTTLAR